MTLIPSAGWIPEAEERRIVRDEVRQRFRSKVGIQPLRSMGDLSLSPQAQLPVVTALLENANPQGSTDIAQGLALLSSALGSAGLGSGGLMAAAGSTSLDFDNLVPQELLKWHFLGEADE
ncbi:hypothetical protein [Neorhizobium galegae]|uniref:Uncharacterized protein n=1 Tax=Neorhizobium galegae bv. officinalis TaxID=323656 RepID=A0A0T7GR24_NEOGA|nr:hypothetical protein [Neorhizobium galegae]CDZ49628.1 Hypothetical protein NGAL_HAMBI1189_30400 [Neorhizobium galegae bv. officinalis]